MKNLPQIYSQRDPQWAAQRLGTVDGTTIGNEGCYISSDAMVAGYFGHTITPNALDDLFTTNVWYVSGNMLTDDGLTKAFTDVRYQQSLDYSNSPADLGKLQQLMADPSQIVILELDFNPETAALETHFVVCVDCDGTKVTIADPWYGTVNDLSLHYGDPKKDIQKFVVYKGNPVGQQVSVDQDTFNKLVHNSTAYDSVCDYFTLLHDVDFGEVKSKLDLLKQNVQSAEQDAATAKLQASQANESMAKVQQDDYNVGIRNVELGHEKDTLSGQLQSLYKALNVPDQQSAIDSITTTEKQFKTLSDHAIVLQKTIDDLTYKRLPKQQNLLEWLKGLVGL